ncbi:hypothetical protein D9619_012639 [Psilocybe cf. subviscida]|uniref:DUF8205 domain-containing protein n=1 Tax=Psilocybe cf. subviscida TaxID=2480587 RepID=A0A8H5B775_9AGAR|nr:hypothetical protein D9619_012639 [Psilocybe cf. subviscida]
MNSASPKPATANKKNVPQAGNPPVLVQCSGLCGRTGGIDGVVLKFCSGCKVMSYCSVEDIVIRTLLSANVLAGTFSNKLRTYRSKHKQYCSKNVEKNLGSFVQRMLSHDHPLRQWIHMCLVKEFSITKENMCAMARKPLYAQMNIGIEPADIRQLFKLQKSNIPADFDHEGPVRGILQMHNIASLDRLPSYTNFATPSMISTWKEVRADMDHAGRCHFPLVILRVMDGFEEHHFVNTVPIFMTSLEEAWKPRSLKKIIQIMVPADAKPNHIAVLEMINFMNELIRADTKNKLRMRTPFRACDKSLLIDAGYEPDPEYIQIVLRSKLFREPIYHAHVLAHPEDAASPMETYLLAHHGKWEAEKERRESLVCEQCAKCTCPT